MIVEELVSKLGLEIDSDALGTLEKFKGALSKGLGGIAVAATAAAAAVAGIVGSAAKAADEIGDVSEKLGVAPKALQELKFAAERSEVSFEGLQTGLKFLAKNAVEAANGNEELSKAFAGVGLRDAEGRIKPANELLASLADKFQTLPDDATRTNLAMKLFERAGADLVPLLKKGSGNIAEMAEKARELGVVFSDDAVAAGGAFDDALKDVRDSLTGLRNEFGAQFFKAFAAGLRFMRDMFVKLRPVVGAIGRGLRMVGTILMTIVDGIMAVGKAISDALGLNKLGGLIKFETILDLISAGVAGLTVLALVLGAKMALAGIMAAGSWLLAAAPFILLGLLIGLLVDDIYNFIEGNDTLLGRVIKWAEAFDPNGNPVIEFFKSAIALLFDLTDPAKWERFISMWMSLNTLLGDITIKAFEYVGAKIAELIGSGIQAVFDKFPLLKKLVGLNVAGAGAVANALGFGDTFNAAKDTVTGALGLGGGPKQSEQIAGQLGGLASRLNPFSGGAAGPDAAGAIASTPSGNTDSRSVKQTNNITINATQMNPDELASHIDNRLQSHNQEAFASFPKG